MRLLLPLLLLLGSSSTVLGAPVVRVTTETTEISSTAPEGPGEVAEAVEWAKADLARAQSANPSLRPEIVILDAEANETYAATPSEDLSELAARISAPRSQDENYSKRHRITFTIVRGVLNTSVVTWGLILSGDVPLQSALSVGLVAGSMSASLQYNNQRLQNWVLQSQGVFPRLARSFVVTMGYLTVAKTVAGFVGMQEPTLVLAAWAVVKTATLNTLSQGVWGLAIAEHANLALERNPAKAAGIKLRNDLKVLALSAISTAVAIADLVGVPMASASMVAMGASGAAYYAWVHKKGKRARRSDCQQLLTP